jgi:hypothetical protein
MKPLTYLTRSVLCLLAFGIGWLAFLWGESLHADPSEATLTQLVARQPGPARQRVVMEEQEGRALVGGYAVLRYGELESLNRIAVRMASMMDAILPVESLVWPHAVRDEQGRVGMFMAPTVSFEQLAKGPSEDSLKGWLVCALIAAGKYAEGSAVTIDHLCFTDPTGMGGDLWCYDVDIMTVRQLHRRLLTGVMTPDEAYQVLIERWRRITEDS